ncbi:MAG: ATP-dependent Lon protease [Acidimicrobiaceae bacterium]|nr:ATP-dependent Lon protease [Acidimicrobiaceae bacterium]
MSVRLPMFPLGTVLVPHGILPLHVFEPRYRVLMFDCMRGEPEFGVVLIERGSEVGGDDQRFGVATVARIAQASELADGRWVVLALGTRRVDVREWLPDDPYPLALVDERAEHPWPTSGLDPATGSDPASGQDPASDPDPGSDQDAADRLAETFDGAERAVRRILALAAELGDEVAPANVELSEDRAVAAWQLLAVAPIGSLDKQRLLGIDDHAERLRALQELAEEQAVLLAYRLKQE